MTDARPILVLSGTAPHTDRWHDLAATSASLAAAIGVATGAPTCVVGLDELPAPDAAPAALVVNASGDLDAPPVDSRPAVDRILALHAAGAGVLGVHSAAYAFRDDPRWAQLLGGRWVPGASGHPPHGPATIDWAPGNPFGERGSLTVLDERYTGLEVVAGSQIVATHAHDGAAHPIAWVRPDARAAYSALGHDPRSHASAGHRRLLELLLGAVSRGPSGAC